jgi:tetratricopeptide (TPR) repeat protein
MAEQLTDLRRRLTSDRWLAVGTALLATGAALFGGYLSYVAAKTNQRILSWPSYGCWGLMTLGAISLLIGFLKRDDQVDESQGRAVAQAQQPAADVEVPTVPHQLPADLGVFVGREHQMAALTRILEEVRIDGRDTVSRTAGIFGGPGIGKTMLAVHWAYTAANVFRDGQLYVNLRGFDAVDPPLEPATAIRGFLSAFGLTAERVPKSFEEQAALYRTLLWHRRVLVVLDNARDEEQVYPLLPGRGFVLVTSRNTLRGLVAQGAQPIAVDLLTDPEATQLIARYVGRDRAAAEPAAVKDLVKLTSRLPLAVAIVGSRAVTRESISLAGLAEELSDESDLLDALETGDTLMSVESVFSWSYRAFSPEAARLFRFIGLHPGPDIGIGAVAALAGTTRRKVERLVGELTTAHFLQESRPRRFQTHDLLQAYARKLAATHDSEDQRRLALTRVFDYYLHSAFAADRQLYPYRHPIVLNPAGPAVAPAVIEDRAKAVEWFTDEIPTLIAVAAYAARQGYVAHAWQLPWAFATFLHRQGAWHDYLVSQKRALDVACQARDPTVIARLERNIGRPYTLLGSVDDALAHYERSLVLCRETNDPTGEALCEDAITWQYGRIRRHENAIEHAKRALALWSDLGSKAGRARALNYIGWNRGRLGHYRESLRSCEESLRLFHEIGNDVGEADTLDSIGYAYQHLGDRANSIGFYERSIALWHQLGDRYNEADVLNRLGDVHRDGGQFDLAVKAWCDALAILEKLGHPDAAAVRAKLDATSATDHASTV